MSTKSSGLAIVTNLCQLSVVHYHFHLNIFSSETSKTLIKYTVLTSLRLHEIYSTCFSPEAGVSMPKSGSQPRRREIKLSSVLDLQKQIRTNMHSGQGSLTLTWRWTFHLKIVLLLVVVLQYCGYCQSQTSSADFPAVNSHPLAWWTLVMPVMAGQAVWIKHCLSVMASMLCRYDEPRANWTLFQWPCWAWPVLFLVLPLIPRLTLETVTSCVHCVGNGWWWACVFSASYVHCAHNGYGWWCFNVWYQLWT